MERVTDIKAPVIGKKYKVQAVLLDGDRWMMAGMKYAPVMGSSHVDKDLGVEFEHFHIDWRFVPARAYAKLKAEAITANGTDGNFEYITVIGGMHYRGLTEKVLEMKREHGEFPFGSNFTPKLDKYIGACMVNNKCPHRGYDLSQIKADGNGFKVCPFHGLLFKNGKVVDRRIKWRIDAYKKLKPYREQLKANGIIMSMLNDTELKKLATHCDSERIHLIFSIGKVKQQIEKGMYRANWSSNETRAGI